MKQAHSAAGAAAELLAEHYLRRQGLTIIDRNFRTRGGEIDLVCSDARTLVFVEVRLRRRNDYGSAADSITAAKRQRIILAARQYLAGKTERACRFDVVLLDALQESRIEWIRDAFAVDGT